MNFPFVRSRLRKAIERGLANGKLSEELEELGDPTLKTRADAEAVCWGLEKLNRDSAQLSEQTYALAGLFQEVPDSDGAAFEVLQQRGIPELLRLFDEIERARSDNDDDHLLFFLKILAMYGTAAGTLKVVEAARRPLKPDGYLWNVILRNFTADHPEMELLYQSLSDPLPEGFIAVSLLDAANAVLIGGGSLPHPFDSAEGRQRLCGWLSSADPEEFSYAHSATAALPFISNPERDSLLDVAMDHPDPGVRVEASWAAAKLGREAGFQRLARHCLDFKTAEIAKRYLSELGREDAIPSGANEPGFAAQAEFAQWLAHPNELGRAPDELEIADHRELPWPPERKARPFWLLKYTIRDTSGLEDDEIGYGLVGSVTWSFFSRQLTQRPPEDTYARHCFWEAEQNGLIDESDVTADAAEYENLLTQWRGPGLEKCQMRRIADISPELGYPQRLVGVAEGCLAGDPGWLILDGPRSEWYPRSEQPSGTRDSEVLNIHVGRYLLGFTGAPDRKSFLAPAKLPRPPAQIKAAYEKLLAQAQAAQGRAKGEAFRSYGSLGRNFDPYVDALLQCDGALEIRNVIGIMAPHWDDPEGWSKLGNAALKCAQLDLAEEFFLKYRDRCSNFERGEEMGLLAGLWCNNGRRDTASQLLLDCLVRLLADSKTASGSDKTLIEEWFQNQRGTLLKLFPAEAETLLAARAIPASTLGTLTS